MNKTPEEIETIAREFATKSFGSGTVTCLLSQNGFEKGYTQCQADNAERKWTTQEVIDIVEKSRKTGLTAEYLTSLKTNL